MDCINVIVSKYNISSIFAQNLSKLYDYKIWILCDDSSVMNEKVGNMSKWNIASEAIVPLVDILDSLHIDFNLKFLNQQTSTVYKDIKSIKKYFSRVPNGECFVRAAFKDVIRSHKHSNDLKQKLLVVILIGGPIRDKTDDEFEFYCDETSARTNFSNLLESNDEIMKKTCVSIVSLDKSAQTIDDLNYLDFIIDNLDVLVDYEHEKEEVLKNHSLLEFTYGDYLSKILLGASTLKIDELDEPPTFMNTMQKYGISGVFAEHLEKLKSFKVIILCDDSGSMNELLPNSTKSKWVELKETCIQVLEILTSCGVRFEYLFLNRDGKENCRSAADIESAFEMQPRGGTPLTERFKLAIESNRELLNETVRRLLIIIFTDGEPTEKGHRRPDHQTINNFKYALTHRQPIDKIHVTIAAVTDSKDVLNYLNNWDKEIKNLDVVDDYETVKDEVLKHGKFRKAFTKGNYIAKILLGSIIKDIDELDE